MSIIVSAILGAIGAGLGHIMMSKITTNKNLITGSSVVMAIFFYQILKPIVYDKYMQTSMNKKYVLKQLKKELVEVNKKLPRVLKNKSARIEALVLNDRYLTYKYTILDKRIKISDIKEREPIIKAGLCKYEKSRSKINSGIEIIYEYSMPYSSNKVELHFTSCP